MMIKKRPFSGKDNAFRIGAIKRFKRVSANTTKNIALRSRENPFNKS